MLHFVFANNSENVKKNQIIKLETDIKNASNVSILTQTDIKNKPK